jgi:UDPglucose--hexose-1-phosphate uridylyltransferase
VPNLYPALERQEVVVQGPEHVQSFGGLPDKTVDLVAEAWQRRARDTDGICMPLLNEGHDAGASLPHSHSQLAWLPALAPAEHGLPELAPALARDGLIAGCPRVSRVPYELLIAPAEPEASGLRSELLGPALRLLAELIRRLQRIQGRELVPLNAWLHDQSINGASHWHLEVFPRLTRLASLELGASVYIDPVAPEQAARELAAG